MAEKEPTINGVPVRNLPTGVDFNSRGIDEWRELLEEVETPEIRIFDLSDANHLAQYEAIFKRQALGQATVYKEDQRWVEAQRTWHVLLRYANIHFEPPLR